MAAEPKSPVILKPFDMLATSQMAASRRERLRIAMGAIRMQDLNEAMTPLTEEMSRMESSLKDMEFTVAQVKDLSQSQRDAFANLQAEFENLKAATTLDGESLEDLDQKVETWAQQFVTLRETINNNRAADDAREAVQDNRLTQLEGTANAAESRLATVESASVSNAGALTASQTAASSLSMRVTVAEEAIQPLQTASTNLTNRVDTLTGRVTTLEGRQEFTPDEKTKLAGLFNYTPPGNATTSAAGFMSASDKTKLNGLSNYTPPGNATPSASGFMSSTDKTKLDGLTNYTPPARTVSNPVRALNTAFQPSATREVLATYSVQISASLTITGGQTGQVILETSPTQNGTFTEQMRAINGNTGGLAVGLMITQIQSCPLTAFIPAGHWVRLRTVNVTSTPVFAFQASQEVLL